MKEKSFKFFVPVELQKSEQDENGEWKIRGIASTPDEDLQGEVVSQDGLDISLLKAGRGLFNFDHQKGPENVLGQIEDAKFVKLDGGTALEVEGYLFKHQDRAKAFYNIMKSIKKGSSPRVHMSIEGKILQRDLANNRKINKARIDKVALTFDPVNPYTYADLVKCICKDEIVKTETGGITETDSESDDIVISRSYIEKLIDITQKAMAAGAGYAKAPQARSGGEALSKESLDKKPKKIGERNRKEVLKSIIEDLRQEFPDEDPLELTELVIDTFLEKF